jgi:hypothetical protein
MNRESLAGKFIEFPIGCIPGARADLAGLADNIVSQPLLFEVAGACMRTICLDADRLFVGDGTAQPALDDQSLVDS